MMDSYKKFYELLREAITKLESVSEPKAFVLMHDKSRSVQMIEVDESKIREFLGIPEAPQYKCIKCGKLYKRFQPKCYQFDYTNNTTCNGTVTFIG
jgi:hypothetical protein